MKMRHSSTVMKTTFAIQSHQNSPNFNLKCIEVGRLAFKSNYPTVLFEFKNHQKIMGIFLKI